MAAYSPDVSEEELEAMQRCIKTAIDQQAQLMEAVSTLLQQYSTTH